MAQPGTSLRCNVATRGSAGDPFTVVYAPACASAGLLHAGQLLPDTGPLLLLPLPCCLFAWSAGLPIAVMLDQEPLASSGAAIARLWQLRCC